MAGFGKILILPGTSWFLILMPDQENVQGALAYESTLETATEALVRRLGDEQLKPLSFRKRNNLG